MLCFQDDRVVMTVNGLKCAFHMPTALLPRFRKNDKGENVEMPQPLPPGAPRFAYPVDEYNCPSNWMHGSAKASSYWLPVRPGCGMWLDFNYAYDHSHHVAVVVSIQGVNPITGQQTKELRLEQYRERCPVHDVPFGQDRFCEACNYKWDAQNYIASNSTPRGLFWIDGFRGDDGIVRQYIFTEEKCKGVAANIIGEDRVFAIGIAFYLSKEPKPVRPMHPETAPIEPYVKTNGFLPSNTISPSAYSGDVATFKRISRPLERRTKSDDTVEAAKILLMDNNPQLLGVAAPQQHTNSTASRHPNLIAKGGVAQDQDFWVPTYPQDDSMSLHQCAGSYDAGTTCTDFDSGECGPADIGAALQQFSPEQVEQEMEKLEIGAGAMIRQRIYQDPEDPAFWQPEPCGMIYINYVDIATAEKIMAGGRKTRAGSFLHSMPVG